MVELTRPLPFIAFDAIMRDPLPPVDWLVEPLIATGSRVVLYGEWGSFKSWLLLHLGLHVAAAQPWLGKFAVPQPKRVLYVDEEMSERTLRRRIKRLAEGAGFADLSLPFRALSRIGVRFNDTGAKNLLSALRANDFDADVIIVESFRRVLVGSELEAKDVSEFWRNVAPILKAGKTLVVSHHMRKFRATGGNASRDRASGSTDILAGADAAFAIQRQSADALVVEHIKSRDEEEAEPFLVTLCEQGKDGPMTMQYEGPTSEARETAKEQDRAADLMVKFLAGRPTQTATAGEINEHLEAAGISERTAQRARSALGKTGRLIRLGGGRWQLPTAPGDAR